MTRQRILYLVHRTPYPPNRGHRIRSFHWLDYLAARAEVDLAFLADERLSQETAEELRRRCRRVIWEGVSRMGQQVRALVSLCRGRSATEAAFFSRRLLDGLRGWVRDTHYDWVIAYCSSMAPYLAALGVPGSRGVVDLVDVDSQKWLDYAGYHRGVKAWLFRLEGRRLRRLEGALASRVRYVTLVSEPEARIYRGFRPAENVRVVENGVDSDWFSPRGAEQIAGPDRPRLVFVGAMDYYPNVDGVSWFLREVWPKLREATPDAVFQVVGAGAGSELRRLITETPAAELVGEVADVRPYLAGGIAVIPLRIARGVQNKVLEAMAMGCPVVASPAALEGLDVEVGRDVLAASGIEEWCDRVTRLIQSPEMRRELGGAARARIENRYQWPDKLEVLNNLLELTP